MLFLNIVVEQNGGLLKCDLLVEDSGIYTISNLFLLLSTKDVKTYAMCCCYCWLHSCRINYSFLQGLGNIVQENPKSDILVEDQLQSTLDMLTINQELELLKTNC